jgi:hypothetical protein
MDVLVEWKTATESNVNRYEIELAKGNDGYMYNRFVKIGEVASRGNSTTPQSYQFRDMEPGKKGVRYYRLKIVDHDGQFSYSPIRPVVFDNDMKWQLYPNPSDGLFTLAFQVNEGDFLKTRVFDINGKTIKETDTRGEGFMQKLVIDLRGAAYAPGIYLLEAGNGTFKQVFRLVKQ